MDGSKELEGRKNVISTGASRGWMENNLPACVYIYTTTHCNPCVHNTKATQKQKLAQLNSNPTGKRPDHVMLATIRCSDLKSKRFILERRHFLFLHNTAAHCHQSTDDEKVYIRSRFTSLFLWLCQCVQCEQRFSAFPLFLSYLYDIQDNKHLCAEG